MGKEFVLFSVDLAYTVASVFVNLAAWRIRLETADTRVASIRVQVGGVPETPATDVERVATIADEIFRVKRVEPGFE